MYTMYYSFSNIPFHKELPHDRLFESISFKEGLARMEHLKKTRGIGLIAGEAGSGKTTVIRAFTGNLNNSLYKVVYFPLSTVSPNDFYRGVLYGLGEIPKSKKVDMFAQIQAAVLTLYKNQKMTPVFVLDEMHLASNAFLDDISLLFNFYMDSENPFILCLIGLPHLIDRLRLMQFAPLEQRIVIRHRHRALRPEEVAPYIAHHLKLAGASSTILKPSAVEAIAAKSSCLPRVINNLTTHALIYGAANSLKDIDEEAVFKACEELVL
jgi:type II secretory pathway predicted ATPase ExeA